jgi:glycosyltransferase involved in cell wall biosynthesis
MDSLPGDIVIGAVGRLEPQKRFDLLIEAFAKLATSRPALRLLIAGEGSLAARFTRRSRRVGSAAAAV